MVTVFSVDGTDAKLEFRILDKRGNTTVWYICNKMRIELGGDVIDVIANNIIELLSSDSWCEKWTWDIDGKTYHIAMTFPEGHRMFFIREEGRVLEILFTENDGCTKSHSIFIPPEQREIWLEKMASVLQMNDWRLERIRPYRN